MAKGVLICASMTICLFAETRSLPRPECDLIIWMQGAAAPNSSHVYYRVDSSALPLLTGSPLVAFGFPSDRVGRVNLSAELSPTMAHAREGFSYVKAEALGPLRASAPGSDGTSSTASGTIRIVFSGGDGDTEILRGTAAAASAAADLLHTSHIYPTGLSGGPVVNVHGDLVGIVQGRMDRASQGLVTSLQTIQRALDVVIRRETAAKGKTQRDGVDENDAFKCKPHKN